MTKLVERTKLHDLIVEILKNDIELYQNVKLTLEQAMHPISKNGNSAHPKPSLEQPEEEELLRRLGIIIKEDFEEYADVFKALA